MTQHYSYSPSPRPGNPLVHWTTSHSDSGLQTDTIIIIDVTSPIKIIEQANIKQLNLKGVVDRILKYLSQFQLNIQFMFSQRILLNIENVWANWLNWKWQPLQTTSVPKTWLFIILNIIYFEEEGPFLVIRISLVLLILTFRFVLPSHFQYLLWAKIITIAAVVMVMWISHQKHNLFQSQSIHWLA